MFVIEIEEYAPKLDNEAVRGILFCLYHQIHEHHEAIAKQVQEIIKIPKENAHVENRKDHAEETRREDEPRGSPNSDQHGIRELTDQGTGLPEMDTMSMLQQDQNLEGTQEETVRETVEVPVENVRTRDPILLDSQQQMQVSLYRYCAEKIRLYIVNLLDTFSSA